MTTPDPVPGTETRGRSKDGSFTEDWGPLLSEERICLRTIWRICLPLLFSEHVSCSYPPSTFKTVLAQVSSPKPSWWAQAFVSGCYTTFQGESHRNLCFLQIQHQQTKKQVYLGPARWISEFTEICWAWVAQQLSQKPHLSPGASSAVLGHSWPTHS